MISELAPNVEQAITKLMSLHDDADLGVVEAVQCGEAAIPALRQLLFRREPSGLFQARCRAVEALAGLGAYSVLFEFLSAGRSAGDPVERLGDDAVINAAALALAPLRDDGVFVLLLRLARRPSLTGVIRALAAFDRPEAVPFLIDALEDDASRPTAAAALKRMGPAARPALIAAANSRMPTAELESESSLRRRRGALGVLHDIGIPQRMWPQLRALVHDPDARISTAAGEMGLAAAPARERPDAVRRLIGMLAQDDWTLRDQIERSLVVHFACARDIIAGFLRDKPMPGQHDERRRRIERSLQRIQTNATRPKQRP